MAAQNPRPRVKSLIAEMADLLPGAALALIMCGAVIYSLSIAPWAPGLALLIPMSLPGFVLGVIFARIRWLRGWQARLLSLILSLAWCVQILGPQMSPLLTSWRDRGTELLIRVIIWGRVLIGGGRGEDLLLFVVALCLLCWAMAYNSAWMLFRHGWTWRTITMNATLALINYTYVLPKPDAPFFVFLGAAMLLLVHQHIVQRQAQWDAQQMEYPDQLAVRFLASAAVVCGLLIMITAALPGSITVDRATRTWQTLSQPFKLARTRWEDAFATLNAPPGAGSGAFAARSAQLGGARQLGNGIVMTVRSTSFDYWRAVAFDTYSNGGWQNTTGEQARAAIGAGTPEQARTAFDPDVPIPGNTYGRREVNEVFTLAQDRGDRLVFVGGVARSLNLSSLVEHNYLRSSDKATPNYDDIALIASRDDLRSGETYTVTAMISQADVESLRATGTTYPAWISDRYLQLPDSVTARTRTQASQIVADAGARTPYDQALAIQNYLRTLRYTESIPGAPAGVDPVDWFLFTQREGYCDYYASSMVVMLRSLGIPARWVQGYAGGTFNTEKGAFEVRENIAHSWPEVYFSGFGWERFEPTPASYTAMPVRPLTPAIDDGSGDSVGSQITPDPPEPARPEDRGAEPDPITRPSGVMKNPESSQNGGLALTILSGLLGTVTFAALAIYLRWRYELRGLSRISAAYAKMELLARWGGSGQFPHSTPHEYAARLANELPAHRDTILQIALAYQTERYQRREITLPTEKDERALRSDLIRHIFTGIGVRLRQPWARS